MKRMRNFRIRVCYVLLELCGGQLLGNGLHIGAGDIPVEGCVGTVDVGVDKQCADAQGQDTDQIPADEAT